MVKLIALVVVVAAGLYMGMSVVKPIMGSIAKVETSLKIGK